MKMAKNPSGHSIGPEDVPIILAMVARGDRDHDIAAWFGVNQGRIAEAKDGKWGTPAAATGTLPPKGPPGIKGRRLRDAIAAAIQQFQQDPAGALVTIQAAIESYESPEA
jgi:hypothetical protein